MSTPASGRFVLRVSPAMHERLRRSASKAGLSLNEFCFRQLERSLAPGEPHDSTARPFETFLTQVRDAFRPDLAGVVLFGSESRGEASDYSDLDLLLVLRPGSSPTRRVYERWDETVAPEAERMFHREVSPQIVALPNSPRDAGGIWYEVAVDGIILWEEDRQVTSFLSAVRRVIAEGTIRRRWIHGQPYWVKETQ